MERELSASPSGSVEMDFDDLSDNLEELIEAFNPDEIRIASPPMSSESEEESNEGNQALCQEASNASNRLSGIEAMLDAARWVTPTPPKAESPIPGRKVVVQEAEPETIELPIAPLDNKPSKSKNPRNLVIEASEEDEQQFQSEVEMLENILAQKEKEIEKLTESHIQELEKKEQLNNQLFVEVQSANAQIRKTDKQVQSMMQEAKKIENRLQKQYAEDLENAIASLPSQSDFEELMEDVSNKNIELVQLKRKFYQAEEQRDAALEQLKAKSEVKKDSNERARIKELESQLQSAQEEAEVQWKQKDEQMQQTVEQLQKRLAEGEIRSSVDEENLQLKQFIEKQGDTLLKVEQQVKTLTNELNLAKDTIEFMENDTGDGKDWAEVQQHLESAKAANTKLREYKRRAKQYSKIKREQETQIDHLRTQVKSLKQLQEAKARELAKAELKNRQLRSQSRSTEVTKRIVELEGQIVQQRATQEAQYEAKSRKERKDAQEIYYLKSKVEALTKELAAVADDIPDVDRSLQNTSVISTTSSKGRRSTTPSSYLEKFKRPIQKSAASKAQKRMCIHCFSDEILPNSSYWAKWACKECQYRKKAPSSLYCVDCLPRVTIEAFKNSR